MVVETVPKDILDKLNAGIELSNVDFDIRDLVYTQDSVEVLQNTSADCKVEVHNAAGEVLLNGIYGWDGSVWETLNTDTNNRLLVSATATNLDIRDLTSASDSVTTVETKATNMIYNAVSITSEVTAILTAHSTRTGFIIVNAGAQTVYLGGDAVTTASGVPLEVGANYSNQDWTGAFYGRVAAGTCDIRIEEFY